MPETGIWVRETIGVDQEFWANVVQWSAGILVTAAVAWWMGRGRLKRRPLSQARLLVHPTSTLVLGLVAFLFFAGATVISNMYPNETVTWWTTSIFVAFALGSLTIVADYFVARHEVSDDGLDYRGMMGQRGYLRWADLRRVSYSPRLKWFRLENRSGDVARLSTYLMGLPEFAGLLLRHAPPAAIEPNALEVLEDTADGDLPPVD